MGDVRKPSAGKPEQVHLDAQEMLAGDEQPALGQQVIDVGDTPVERILHRHHPTIGDTFLHGADGVLEGRAGQCLVGGEERVHGGMAEGAGLALEGDFQ